MNKIGSVFGLLPLEMRKRKEINSLRGPTKNLPSPMFEVRWKAIHLTYLVSLGAAAQTMSRCAFFSQPVSFYNRDIRDIMILNGATTARDDG